MERGRREGSSNIRWSVDGLRPDPVYGAGADRWEKGLALGTGLFGAVAVVTVVVLQNPTAWAWWQYALALVIAFDLMGGVVANGLNSAKREHFGPEPHESGPLARLARRPVLFSLAHVQPVLVGLLFPGPAWWWGIPWWLAVLLAAAVVQAVPLYLKRPCALGACAMAAVVAPLLPSPFGFWWLPVIIALKLVLAHAVPEEPYRPAHEQ